MCILDGLNLNCTLTFSWFYNTGGPPRPGMLPTPPMGGPPMMPMMGPPPHGMMPGGPGKKHFSLTTKLFLMCLKVLSQSGCVQQMNFIQTKWASKAVSITSIRSALSKAYYWPQRVSLFFLKNIYIGLHLFPFLRDSSKNIPDNKRPLVQLAYTLAIKKFIVQGRFAFWGWFYISSLKANTSSCCLSLAPLEKHPLLVHHLT